MRSREAGNWALLSWAVLVLISFGAQRFADPARRGREEAEGWRLLQERFIDEARTERSLAREDLLSLYEEGLDGFRPIAARLLPVPDLSPQRHGALLDRGRDDGVEVGQGVIGRTGVIGLVAEVGARRSRLIFSDDPNFRASFRIEEKGRGMVAGGPGRGELHPLLRFDRLDLAEGDLLVTSGGDGRFPRSLVIGIVREARLPLEASRIAPPPGTTDGQEVLVLALPALGEGR